MRRRKSRWPASLVCAGAAMLAVAPSAAAELAPDASSIRPLLVGAAVPAVSVRDAEGAPVDLRVLVSKQPTVLIFYRGGW